MLYRIFTESPDGSFDAARLSRNAKVFFRVTLEVLEHEPRKLTLRLHPSATDDPVEIPLMAREVTKKDMKDVTDAERWGHAAGMGAIAARCRYLWEMTLPDDLPEAAALSLCAALASVALGPVLPPDKSTLFGVREAIERAREARDSNNR